jgi:hypothetical protein
MLCFGSHFENGRHLENFETQNCSSNGDLSLCQILYLYHYPFRSYLTMLNFCRIVTAILKIASGRNFSMSGINNVSAADLRNYWTEFHETWLSYRYMFLVDPKVFRFVVKGVKAIFLGVQRGWGLL